MPEITQQLRAGWNPFYIRSKLFISAGIRLMAAATKAHRQVLRRYSQVNDNIVTFDPKGLGDR